MGDPKARKGLQRSHRLDLDPGQIPSLESIPEEHRGDVQKMVEEHWKNWVDEPIDALGGATPREAAQTERGRAALLHLLDRYEAFDRDHPDNIFRADQRALRSELGLEQL